MRVTTPHLIKGLLESGTDLGAASSVVHHAAQCNAGSEMRDDLILGPFGDALIRLGLVTRYPQHGGCSCKSVLTTMRQWDRPTQSQMASGSET
jgi:hypothetical protein